MGDATDPGAVRFSVLGSLQVTVDGNPARIRPGHPEHLLSVLLAAQGDFVSVEQLVDRLWGDQPPSAAASTLHSHVRAVRSALGDGSGVIANERGRGYRIRFAPTEPDGATCDLLDFRAHVAAARELVRTDELDAARTELRCALELWRGEAAFPELIDDLDARSLVVELTSLREWAEQQAVDLAMRSGDPAAVIPDLEAALARDPADQRTAARLMRAYASSGRPERASAVYADLVRLLRERSGDVPLPELAELDGRILRHDPEVVSLARPAPTASSAPPSRIAVPELGAELTSFVGRTAELDHLAAAIAASRVVTVVGAGGCGKTRLAREVARRVGPSGGVALAQLAEVAEGDTSGVIEQVAGSVGSTARSADELASELVGLDDDLLLVLDNCEHVLEPVALLAVALLERASSLRVLVTSREALHLPGERVVPLPPMPTVRIDASGSGEPSDGAALFVTRAVDAGWRVDTGAVLADPVQLRAVETICARLDGLPLAIELVAPLAGMYTLDDLGRRLVDQPDVARPVRSPHLRQRTLGDVIEWSVSRLTEHEHAALLTASVFAGPFTPAAFEAVAAAVWADSFDGDGLMLLDALVGRSLLSPRSEDGVTRFRLLETIRAHTRRAARARDLADTLAAAHAHHFAAEAGRGPSAPGDRADQRAALLWCIDTGNDDLGIELLDGVGIHMYRLALPPSVASWLERLGAGDGPNAAAALDLRAMHALFSGDYERLDRIADRAVTALREAGDDRRAAKAGVVAAFSYVLADDTDEAERLLADARAGDDLDEWLASWADAVEGLLARRAGRLDEAEQLSARALADFTARGDRFGALLPTLNLGRVQCDRGDLDAGLAQIGRGIAVADALGDHLIQTLGHAYAARVLLTTGDASAAIDRLVAGLATARLAPNRVLVASLFDYTAGVLVAFGDHESAATLLGAASAQRPGGAVDPLGLASGARDALGPGSFGALVAAGATGDVGSGVDLAVGCLTALR
ncbi:MAG: BTAD domain-containing putative transcriptional regulator [Actinomycetota bacterium]